MPWSRKSAPSRVAVVRIPPRSEPASGSVKAKAHSTSPWTTAGSQRFFCRSVPPRLTGCEPRPCMANAVSASDEK
jgi:hypothetical protein